MHPKIRKINFFVAIFTLVILLVPSQLFAVAYDVPNGTLSVNEFDFGAQTSGPRSMAFANSGLRLFIGDADK
ncbi:hypothetical protein HON52_00735 [Candidatus Uhrbacteria bacterium]|jgi:hypothetical protein|nr:hypothetical protein [Candidatus Uhrbacteria bacterium]